jgi:hypothetical protein
MHSRATISLLFLLTTVSLTACVQEEVAKKKPVSSDAKPKTCLLEPGSAAGKAIPSPQPAPERTVADDIYKAYNCSKDLGIRWDKPLFNYDLILNGKIIVYGRETGCSSEGALPLLQYPSAVNAELKKSIDSYNLMAQKKLVESNERLSAALKAAKSCSFKNPGDLFLKLNAATEGMRLDQAYEPTPDYALRAYTDLLNELACLGNPTIEASSIGALLKEYDTLRVSLANDPSTKPRPSTSGGGKDESDEASNNPCD